MKWFNSWDADPRLGAQPIRANLRRPVVYRPRLETLEERLPPGDTVLGAVLGAAWMEATWAFPTQSGTTTDIAITDSKSVAFPSPLRREALGEGQPAPLQAQTRAEGQTANLSPQTGVLDADDLAAWYQNIWFQRQPARWRGAADDLPWTQRLANLLNGFTGEVGFNGAPGNASAGERLSSPAMGLTPGPNVSFVLTLSAELSSPKEGPIQATGGVHALFNLDVQAEAPFPTNVFTVPDPTQNTGRRVNLPYPDCKVYVSQCEDLNVINTLDGFNMQPRLSIPFDGPIDVNSVTSNTVFLISLGDTLNRHDHGGQVVGINQVVGDVATNALHVESDELLAQHTRYALIVTNGLHDTSGAPVEATEAFRRFRHDVRGEYRRELLDAIHAARRLGVRERDIVTASVFTTESATAILEKIRDQIHAATPDPADFLLGPKGERTVFNRGDVTGIHWEQQTGDDPPSFTGTNLNLSLLDIISHGAVGQIAFGKYFSPDYEIHPGEYIPAVGTYTGTPAVEGTNEIYFNLFLPSGPKPEGGWPVAIFGHALTQDKNVTPLQVVGTLAAHGIATVAINVAGNGFGPLGTLRVNQTMGDPVTFSAGGRGIDQNGDHIIGSNEGQFATAPQTIISNRDGQRQTVADLMQLVRVIEVGMDVNGDGSRDLDPSRMYYSGQSLGGIYGTLFLTVEPDVRAGVLTVAGGPLAEFTRLSPIFRAGFAYLPGGDQLASRVPSLINSPGITEIGGVPVSAPFWNENMPLRDGIPLTVRLDDGTSHVIQSPVINTVAGAMAIQEVIENTEWVSQSANPVAFAPHLRKDPLAGVPAKSVIFQFAKGDQPVPNPTTTAILRAGDLADRATFYRNDLAFADDPTVPRIPHGFMVGINLPGLAGMIARGAQEQIAVFFASDGATIIHPDPAQYFEVPITLPLPEDLNYIP